MNKHGKDVTDPIDVDLPKADAGNLKNLFDKNLAVENEGTSGDKDNNQLMHKKSFDALTNDDAGQDKFCAAMREEDLVLEKEINTELVEGNTNDDDTDSQNSEFVDATQQILKTVDSEACSDQNQGRTEVNSDHGSAEADDATVEKDNTKFLQQSWANMAEDK